MSIHVARTVTTAPTGRRTGTAAMQVSLLGGLHVRVGTTALGPRQLGGVKPRHLLIALAVARGVPVSKEASGLDPVGRRAARSVDGDARVLRVRAAQAPPGPGRAPAGDDHDPRRVLLARPGPGRPRRRERWPVTSDESCTRASDPSWHCPRCAGRSPSRGRHCCRTRRTPSGWTRRARSTSG